MAGETLVVPAGGTLVWLKDTGDKPAVNGLHRSGRWVTLGLSLGDDGTVYRQCERNDNISKIDQLQFRNGSVETLGAVAGSQTGPSGSTDLLSFTTVSLRGQEVFRTRVQDGFGLSRHVPGLPQPQVLNAAASIASPVLVKDAAVYGDLKGHLHVVSLSGEGKTWSFRTAFGKSISAPVAVSEGRIWFGCEDGYLYVLGPGGKAPLPSKDLQVWKIRSPLSSKLADSKYDRFSSFGSFGNTNASGQGLEPPRGAENPLWNQIVENNEWNAFYDGKRLKVENIRIPTFIICGWWDYYTCSAFRCWSTIKRSNPSTDVRALIGATNHVSRFPPDGRKYPGGREDAAGEAIRWLDYVLKGEQNGVGGEPPIKVFTMGSNQWQRYSGWPPAAQETKFYLRNVEKDRFGFLDTTPPAGEPTSEYDYDPDNPVPTLGGNHSIWFHHKLVSVGSFDHSEHEQRPDVLVFSTASLSEDTEVTGPVAVNFWAASDAKDTDWTAILLDVEPDGKPYNVTMGILRARYRRGILKAPELLLPGAVEQYSLELMPTSYTFKKGHRIRLCLSSSNFPLWDRNPNTGGEIHLETRTRVAHQTIYHDTFRPSHVVLPIVSDVGF